MPSDDGSTASTRGMEETVPRDRRTAVSAPPPPPGLSSESASSSKSRFYATPSSRPFSRSALKRQSVHTLPSIKHLQHGFAKMSLIAERNKEGEAALGTGSLSTRRKSGAALRPLGMNVEGEDGGGDGLDELGPQPDKPEVDLRMPWEREDGAPGLLLKDAAQLRADVLEALDAVCDRWFIQPAPSRTRSFRRSSSCAMSRNPSTASDAGPPSPGAPADINSSTDDLPLIPALLATTTLAVRAVQAFAVSLPAALRSGEPPPSPRKPNPLEISTAARPRTSLALPFSVGTSASKGVDKAKGKGRVTEGEQAETDPLVVLRRTSLDVLGMLRELEARYRAPACGLHVRAEVGWTEMRTSPVDIAAPQLSPAISPPASASSNRAPAAPPTYRTDIDLVNLASEADLVERWVRVVESELDRSADAAGRNPGGGISLSPHTSLEPDEEGPEPVPAWAREVSGGSGLAQAYAIMLAHAPVNQRPGLPDPAVDQDGFLDALSDGTVLCSSYNAVLRSPRIARPFGFIPSSSIHSFPSAPIESAGMVRTASSTSTASDGGERVGGTFRRAENLGQWAAALKHRYAAPLPSFDPRAIAAHKSDVDWRALLGSAVETWADVVAREAREVWAEASARRRDAVRDLAGDEP